MKVDIRKRGVCRATDGAWLDPAIEVFEVELHTDPSEGTVPGVWRETFGSRQEVERFMRGVEAGRAMSGHAGLQYEIP